MYELRIRAGLGRKFLDVVTADVSYRGLFICTDTPPPLRQLIRLEATLPPQDTPFAAHGMVVHVVPPGGSMPAGIGVQFYGMGSESKTWESFVRHVAPNCREALDSRYEQPEPIDARESSPDSGPHDNREFTRFPIVLEVKPHNLDELLRLYTRDVSMGGMFLTTSRTVDIGTELRLDVRHPHDNTVFALSAVVRRHSDKPQGLGLELVGLDDNKRRAFFDFIHAPIPTSEFDEADLAELD